MNDKRRYILKQTCALFLIWVFLLQGCASVTGRKSTEKKETQPDLRRLESFWGKLCDGSEIVSHGLFSFVDDACRNNWSQDKIAKALAKAEELQFRDPAHKWYGNFLWYSTQTEPESGLDENAAQFCMFYGIQAKILYTGQMDERNNRTLDELIRLSTIAILRHQVDVKYTNIYLMKSWNLMAIGETYNCADVASVGYEMLENWIRWTAVNGIGEYNSPTYAGVSVEPLALMCRYVKNPVANAQARAAMDFFSFVIFASYFNAGGYLSGPQARNYDYCLNRGRIDRLYMDHFLEGAPVGADIKHLIWTPPIEAIEAYRKVPRMVYWKWGSEKNKTSYSYIGHSFNIGSSGASSGPDDKNLIINLSSSADRIVNNICYVIEGRDDPYGAKPVLTSGGHSKPRHLYWPYIDRVQQGSEFVVIVAADGREREDTKQVRSHILLPASKIAMYDGEKSLVDPGTIREKTLESGMFFARFNSDVAVGIRFLTALNVDGERVPVKLCNDGYQTDYGTVMRLTAVHSQEMPALGQKGVIAMWWKAEEGVVTESQFDDFRHKMMQASTEVSVSGSDYTVIVDSPWTKGKLGIQGNIATGTKGKTWGMEPVEAGSVFAIDGKDKARQFFSKLISY